jgi:transposase
MGKKKVLIAVAHRMLVIVYHLWSRRTCSGNLGEDVCKQRSVHTQSQRLIRPLEAFRVRVTVESRAKAA